MLQTETEVSVWTVVFSLCPKQLHRIPPFREIKTEEFFMKIKYAFLDGTVTEVEVSDEIGAVIIDSRKAEHAQDERHRYHCYS